MKEGNNNRTDRDFGRDPNDKRISIIFRKTYDYLSRKSKAWKGAMMAFIVLIVFITTYGLILPAITIEKDIAQEMPGMDLASDSSHDEEYRTSGDPAESNTAGQEVNESSGAKIEGDSSTEDKDSHENSSTSLQLAQSPLKYNSGSYEYELIFDKTARIPEGTIFTVEEVRKNSIEYTSYKKALEKSQAVADLDSDDNDSSDGKDKSPSSSGTIVPKSFLRLKLYKDGEEIRPDQPVKLVINDKRIETGKSDANISHPEYGVIFRTKASDKELTASLIKLKYDNDSSPITISRFPYNKKKTQPVIGLAYKKTDSQGQAEDQSGNSEDGEKEAAEEGSTVDADGAEKDQTAESGESITFPESDFQAQTDHLDITVHAPEGALPEGTIMRVREIKDKDALKAITETVENSESDESSDKKEIKDNSNKDHGEASKKEVQKIQAVDITFTDKEGHEIEPLKDVQVTISSKMVSDVAKDDDLEITAVHLDDQGTGSVIDIESKKDKVSFESDSFSVYALVSYTVDFHWEVDGKKYTFSIRGGDSISFSTIAELMNLSTNYKKLQNANSPDSGDINESVKQKNEDLSKSSDEAEEGVVDISALDRDSIKLSEETKAFLENVELVEFSKPDLVWVHNIKEDTTAGKLIADFGLSPQYPHDITQNECMEMYLRSYSAPDWVIMALKPFDTEEKLIITMKDGGHFEIRVTDAGADATEIDDGQGGKKVQTIDNPSGTTIDLFDYWIVDNKRYVWNRLGWPEQIGDQNSYNYKDYNYSGTKLNDQNPPMHQDFSVPNDIQWYVDNNHLRGNGNNQGINSGHAFKFYPGVAGTVEDYGNKGNSHTYNNNPWTNNHDGYSSINSWTGDADPTTGLVLDRLVNGYPQLTNDPSKGTGTGNNSQVGGKYPSGESLAYLFNPDISHSGKEYMGSVDQLLYVDSDGYYTYDSRYYSATYNNDKTFTVRKFADSVTGNARGFWPMGDQYNWHGMHVTTKFSMPANGKVLNPKGEYKDMQFEFSGDDDTWLYVDGILVGDGGGIHNRTEIDINFATGIVTVTGTKDNNHQGTYTSTKTLREIFQNAENQGWVESGYVAKNFETGSNTFKQGTYHTFEMFYLERGGSESNLYIHYNLVSTTDFSAHKSYHMLQDDPHARLERDQFKFELIGFDNAANGVGFEQAIMPDRGAENGAGTVASPKKKHYETAPEGLDLPSNLTAHTSLITGVTEDGNVNFGNVQLQESQVGKQYKYVVREVVPADAENADHVRWDEASPEVKAEGGFIKDNITYDGKVYYFIGTVQLKEGATDEYEIKKTRYTDSSYTTEDTETKFFNFVNGYVKPITLKVLKKSETGKALSGAEFSLTRAMKNDSDQWVVRTYQHDGETVASAPRTGTTSAGVLTFDNLTEGHYILEETVAPSGYTRNETYRWLLSLTKQDAADKIILVPTIQAMDADGNLIGTATELTPDASNVIEHEVLNGKIPVGDITVEKKWLKVDGTSTYIDAELEALGVDGTKITGELWRKGDTTIPANHPTVTIYAKLDNESDYQQKWQGQIESGSNISYSMAVNSTGYPSSTTTSTGVQPVQASDQNITYDNGINKSSGHVYTLQNVTEDVKIYAQFDHTKANNLGIGFYLVSKVDPTTTASTQSIDTKFDDFTLEKGNWSKTWTAADLYGSDLDEDWTYYFKNVTESPTPTDFVFTESPEINVVGTTTTYSYKNIYQKVSVKIVKVIKDSETPLSGVEFTLTQVDSEKHVIKDEHDQPITQVKTTEETTGELTFEGLTPGGWYMLEETGMPAGYIKKEGPYYIYINEDGSGVLDTTVTYELISPNNGNEYTVENEPGAALPSTGGPGTNMIYLLGIMLTGLAGAVLVMRKRRRTV